ncbi:unnamed protein product [Polarella glacialis]|uniref:Resolvase/invertase-type recombinase catalytic domain-containing protein n=1 Tax=Polarella glacialis TaxID=89957 RepID=A0A813H3S4_POLGL|nr:unnamed protein product [Polarella glacialis]
MGGKRPSQMHKRATGKAAVYSRVSTKTNAKRGGVQRQSDASLHACRQQSLKVALSVAEVVSGSLPLDKRGVFQKLLHDCKEKNIKKLFVESTRAVARDANVTEALFQLSKKLGVSIIPSDVPDLFVHNPNPAQKFLRRVIAAATELEKNLAVQRLQAGLQLKLTLMKKAIANNEKFIGKKPVAMTQYGKAKINGRLSILQKIKKSGKLTSDMRLKIKRECDKYEKGKFGLRTLAETLSKALKKKARLGPETARRMVAEIKIV